MSSAEAISKHFLKSEEQQWLDVSTPRVATFPLPDTDIDTEQTFQTNVVAGYFMSMAFLPLLATGGTKTPGYSAQVVNVSSISGSMKGTSSGQPAYASSKAAFTHLSRMLATTFKDVKVRVNVIA